MIQENENIKEIKKIKIDKNSILFKLWTYFSLFSIIILITLWLLQTVLFSYVYETLKIHEVTKVGNTLRNEYNSDNFQDTLINFTNSKGLTISVLDEDGAIVYPVTWFQLIESSKSYMSRNTFDRFFGTLERENLKYKVTTMRFEKDSEPRIIYSGYLGENGGKKYYVIIDTVLKPVDVTVDVTKRILLMVTILSLFSGMFLAYFLSRRLSQPLVRMSNTAKALADGDYNVYFKKGEYTEIDNLSKTLNYAKDELTKTIEVRKDLIANVSHDLKTPLTVIKSYGEMIRDISGNNEKMRNEHLNTIISEADNLTNLVNDLLDLSKVESELEDIKKQDFDLAEVVEKVAERFKYFKGFPINFQIYTHGNTKIVADKKKIEQVIYNFINNAINYSKDDKEIILKIIESDKGVEFHCIDHGIGISEKDIKDIWDRFYRVSNNHTRPSVGTGLGLYIVKTILNMHKFPYGVNSKLGQGSDFYFVGNRN
ncbi:HAMP domain-containing sensor histidine kinase [Peptoniphilus lacrimalis]|uniref:sensor histidine kinase n=1 Tax=Peptoniphilus lacrimalis TaxID=33031 RepID=UPI00050F050B|nr:HAMP domain-containing sensor histidine kinase [Peptoniphilus lacrimalis]KGF36866.1 histidine kinase [Peptoniphilus lacrimalis DNF00528]MDK7721532.1 HAMP domain-containing sensor histidine kinase [Peptoniphilus lacrimalis]MDK7731134.1 HAMP domain-containing sensor histidine kinase [Peptoniphilus lacrimalis]